MIIIMPTPIIRTIEELIKISNSMHRHVKNKQYMAAGIICDSMNTKEGCGTVVRINNRSFCLTAAHVLPRHWRELNVEQNGLPLTFQLNRQSYQLLPPTPGNILYNGQCDIALLEIATSEKLHAAQISLIPPPIRSWKVDHTNNHSTGATPLFTTGDNQLRHSYMERISTEKPGTSGSGLINITGHVFGIHRQANTWKIQESTLPADSIMVGIEKEGCLLKDVWQMLDYNDTTNSDLFNLLNDCATKEGLHRQNKTYLNKVHNIIENDPARWQLDSQKIFKPGPMVSEEKNKGLPIDTIKKYLTKHEWKKHYCRTSFKNHALNTQWGNSDTLTVFRLNNEDDLKECVRKNGSSRGLLVSKASDFRMKNGRLEEITYLNSYVVVTVNNHKICHVHGIRQKN